MSAALRTLSSSSRPGRPSAHSSTCFGGVGVTQATTDERAARRGPGRSAAARWPNRSAWRTAGGPTRTTRPTNPPITSAPTIGDRHGPRAAQPPLRPLDQRFERERQQDADAEQGRAPRLVLRPRANTSSRPRMPATIADRRTRVERDPHRRPRVALPPPKGPRSGRTPSVPYVSVDPDPGMRTTTARLLLTPSAVVLIFGSIVVALVARNLLVAARRPLGWAVAALVMAAAIEPMVSRAEPVHAPRVRAALRAHPADRRSSASSAAASTRTSTPASTASRRPSPRRPQGIEESDRFGGVARDLELSREGAGHRRRPREAVVGRWPARPWAAAARGWSPSS